MTGRAALALLAVALVAGCGSPQTTRSPSPSAAASPGGADACARAGGSREWTTERSYFRGIVPRGDSIQLGLGGRPDAAVRATVKAPDGSELSSTRVQEQRRGTAANYVVRYPADFTPAGVTGVLGITAPGTYTVVWEASRALAACDTFEVARTGVADARSCAPPGWSATAPGSTLVMGSGTASMSITGDQALLGIVGDPWYAFEPTDRQTLTLPDGATTTLIVSRTSPPRRVAAQFRAGQVPYRFDASADGLADLVERSREAILCAQQRLASTTTAPALPTCATTPRPAATIDPRPVVFPADAVIRIGGTQQFITGHQEGGCFGAATKATWTVSPATLGTITEDGLFTAREAGSGTVTAISKVSGISGSASVRVER